MAKEPSQSNQIAPMPCTTRKRMRFLLRPLPAAGQHVGLAILSNQLDLDFGETDCQSPSTIGAT